MHIKILLTIKLGFCQQQTYFITWASAREGQLGIYPPLDETFLFRVKGFESRSLIGVVYREVTMNSDVLSQATT